MKFVRRFFIAVTILAVGGFVWWAGMNYTGYCHAEGRYLSDEEKINSAIRFALYGYPPSISKEIEVNVNGTTQKHEYWYVPENPIKYKDIDDFMAINPGCCKLSMRTGEGDAPSFLDRITGYVSTYVIVKFKVRYFDEQHLEKFANSGVAVAVKNCGESWSGL
jgi:hypothetical protein